VGDCFQREKRGEISFPTNLGGGRGALYWRLFWYEKNTPRLDWAGRNRKKGGGHRAFPESHPAKKKKGKGKQARRAKKNGRKGGGRAFAA